MGCQDATVDGRAVSPSTLTLMAHSRRLLALFFAWAEANGLSLPQEARAMSPNHQALTAAPGDTPRTEHAREELHKLGDGGGVPHQNPGAFGKGLSVADMMR